MNLDQRMAELFFQNAIVNRSFTLAGSETEALKLAVVTLSEALEVAQKELGKPRKFEWQITGNTEICPECLEIRETSK